MSERSLELRVASFLDGSPHAVVGASRDRAKYGNKVLRAYQQDGRPVYPVNPSSGEIEGLKAYASLRDLPVRVHGVSIITPPAVTERIVVEAAELGIRHIWMQPGAESAEAIAQAAALKMNCIAGDACVLVVLRYRDH